MEVKLYQLWEGNLPEDIADDYSHYPDKYFNVLVVTHEGEIIMHRCDRMEPEDATFHRDLNFVLEWVTRAYNLGRQQGQKDGRKEAFNTMFSDDHVDSPSEPR